MKTVLFYLLLAGGPPWLAWNLASAEVIEPAAAAPVIVVQRMVDGQEEGAELQVGGELVVRAEVAPGAADGRSDTKQVRVLQKIDKDAAQRGWLGVSIDEVPEALAAQLDTDGRGVLVTNVMEGSPADKAGFQVHDVIVSVDGQAVEGESLRAIDLIKSRKPGDTAKFGVLRNGQEITVTATLGSRADMGATGFTWKVEAPPAEVKERIQTRGKFLRREPGGTWTVKDLGDLGELPDLPDNIKVFVPKSGERSVQVFVEDGKKTIRTEVDRDGGTIAVEQKDDGPITVTRTDEDGKETVASYDDEDALRAADEEAYEIYSEAGKSVIIKLDGGAVVDGDFDFDFDFDADAWKDSMLEWRTQLDGSLKEAHEAYEKAMEEVHESMAKLKEKGFDGQFKFDHLKGLHGDWPMAMGFAHLSKPRHTFEVRTDGTIEAKVRKGDSELVQLYKNESDLKQRNPELYAKYQELMSIKE